MQIIHRLKSMLLCNRSALIPSESETHNKGIIYFCNKEVEKNMKKYCNSLRKTVTNLKGNFPVEWKFLKKNGKGVWTLRKFRFLRTTNFLCNIFLLFWSSSSSIRFHQKLRFYVLSCSLKNTKAKTLWCNRIWIIIFSKKKFVGIFKYILNFSLPKNLSINKKSQIPEERFWKY